MDRTIFNTIMHLNQVTPKTRRLTMKELTAKDAINVASVEDCWLNSWTSYIKCYRRITKRANVAELNDCIDAEFNIEDIQLRIPELPPPLYQSNDYTLTLPLDQMAQLYDAAVEGFSLL